MRTIAGYAVLSLLAMAGLIPMACGGDKKQPAQPTNPSPSMSAPPMATAQADAGAPTASASADAGPPPSPLSTVVTTDPAQVQALLQAAQNASSATLQSMSAGGADPVEAGIKALAAKHAKKMTPDGQMAKGDLKEGDHLSMMVNLQAGKCYALIGFSPKGGVQDLDLRLLAPPFYTMISGEDTSDDNSPVVGKDPSPMCPLVPIPLAYKVDIHAQKGAGKAGVQLYSRPAK